MANLLDLILKSGDNNLAAAVAAARSPGNLFKDATWDQIGSNQELTKFLHSSLDANGSKFSGNDLALQNYLIQYAEEARGSEIWLALFDTTKKYPSSIHEHQFLNLLERLYLTSPFGYGKKSYFGTDIQSVEERQSKLYLRSAIGVTGTLLLFGSIWMLKRRNSVPQLERYKSSNLSENADRKVD